MMDYRGSRNAPNNTTRNIRGTGEIHLDWKDSIRNLEFQRKEKCQYAIFGSRNSIKILDFFSGKIVKNFSCHRNKTLNEDWVIRVEILPKGMIASCSADVIIWKFSDGINNLTQIRVLSGHTDCVWDIKYCGRYYLCSCSRDKTLRCWNILDGKEISIMRSDSAFVKIEVLSVEFEMIVSSSIDKTFRIWNWRSGVEIRRVSCPEMVFSLGVLDKNTIVTGLNSNKDRDDKSLVQVYDIQKRKVTSVFTHGQGRIYSILVLNEKEFLTGSENHTIKLFHRDQPQKRARFVGHKDMIDFMKIYPGDRNVFCSCSLNDGIKVWNIPSQMCIDTFPLEVASFVFMESPEQINEKNVRLSYLVDQSSTKKQNKKMKFLSTQIIPPLPQQQQQQHNNNNNNNTNTNNDELEDLFKEEREQRLSRSLPSLSKEEDEDEERFYLPMCLLMESITPFILSKKEIRKDKIPIIEPLSKIDLNILRKEIMKTLFGYDSWGDLEYFFDKFLFFFRMNMMHHAYILCRQVVDLKTNEIVFLYVKCIKTFEDNEDTLDENDLLKDSEEEDEKDDKEVNQNGLSTKEKRRRMKKNKRNEDEDEDSSFHDPNRFKCCLTFACHKELLKRVSEIRATRSIARALEKVGKLIRILNNDFENEDGGFPNFRDDDDDDEDDDENDGEDGERMNDEDEDEDEENNSNSLLVHARGRHYLRGGMRRRITGRGGNEGISRRRNRRKGRGGRRRSRRRGDLREKRFEDRNRLEKHPNFFFLSLSQEQQQSTSDGGIREDISSFGGLFSRTLERLYRNKRYWNVELRSEEDPQGEIFQVHREILIYRSSFFYKMFSFPGRESEESIVLIAGLNTKQLKCVLDWIYLGKIEKETELSLVDVSKVLIHSEMYFEKELNWKMIHLLRIQLKKAKDEGSLSLRVLEIGHLLDDLPESTKEKIFKDWKGARLNIDNLLYVSKRCSDLVRQNERLDEELEQLMGATKRKREEENEKEILPNAKRRKVEDNTNFGN